MPQFDSPRPGVFILRFVIFAVFFCTALVVCHRMFAWSFADEMLLFLFPPVYYSASHYKRRIYLIVYTIGIAASLITLPIIVRHIQPSAHTLTMLCITLLFSMEGTFRSVRRRRSIESELERAHAELEKRVEERTQELAIANQSLQNEIQERKRAEEILRQQQSEEYTFQGRLVALQEISNELASAPDVDTICRRAIELGRGQMGFDRLSIWFIDPNDPDYLTGTFGTDETGNIRDERNRRFEMNKDSLFKDLMRKQMRVQCMLQQEIYNDRNEPVGEGSGAIVAIRNANTIIGFITVDNLLERKPIDDRQCELLTLFASTIGHLCTLKQQQEEHDRLEGQLRQSQKLKAIGMLAGGVAHEFNNLLTGILGNLRLAQYKNDIDKLKQHLLKAENSARHAAILVKELLAFGRKTDVYLDSIEVNEILNRVIEEIQNGIDERFELILHTDDNLPMIMADSSKLQQVLRNLCANAYDALHEKLAYRIEHNESAQPLTIEVNVETCTVTEEKLPPKTEVHPGNYIRFRVADNGKGMDTDTQQHVFEPFFTTKEVGKGTGLGLAMVYGIIEQHKGWIEMQSKPDTGTTFDVFIPAVENEAFHPVEQETTLQAS